MNPDLEAQQTERRIMAMMRKVLSAVARDTAPGPGRRNALSEQTIQDIRDCMVVISQREQELAKQLGKQHKLKPRFADEPGKSKTVPLSSLEKKPKP